LTKEDLWLKKQKARCEPGVLGEPGEKSPLLRRGLRLQSKGSHKGHKDHKEHLSREPHSASAPINNISEACQFILIE
jgi:hypothetical protein